MESPYLEQAKLDVLHKTRANLFNWRGQFTPEFIEYLLSIYAREDDTVVDPFAGSGTVLLESARKCLSCCGLEINPAAYAMSHFYTLCTMTRSDRVDIMGCLDHRLHQALHSVGMLPLFSEGDTFREQYRNLVEFAADFFGTLESELEKILALNLFFLSEGQKRMELSAAIWNAMHTLKRAALHLPHTTQPVTARLCDARQTHLFIPQPATLILTSPPYINVFNYHQNHRALLEAAGWKMLTVAASEFGSNRKNRGNRFKTIFQYCLDMEQTLQSFWHSLKENGLLIMIIGRESNVRGTAFYNGRMTADLLEGTGGFTFVNHCERKFLNKFGTTIFEDILIYRKSPLFNTSTIGMTVAVHHLESALAGAPEAARQDIRAALAEREAISPSPIFHAKDAYHRDENAA